MTHDDFDIATLCQVVADTREKILKHNKYYTIGGRSEIRVRAQLIDPILRALGWDPANQQKVILEYDTVTGSGSASHRFASPQAHTPEARYKRRFVDYALCLNDTENLSPCAIVEAKQMQMSHASRGSKKKDQANFPEKDLRQLFDYTYNIIFNELAYKGDLLYKVISNGDVWLIYSGEERNPINQLICELQLSDNSISLDTIVANLSMLSFPAIKYKAERKQYGKPITITTLSNYKQKRGVKHKCVAVKIGDDWLPNKSGQTTDLWKIILDDLSNKNEWKKLVDSLPIKKAKKLILENYNADTSSMNRSSNRGRGNKNIYVFKANKTQIVFEATAGIVLEDLKVVMDKCGVDKNSVFLEIEMDN